MMGPVVTLPDTPRSVRALPQYFNRSLIIYEWSRNYFREVDLAPIRFSFDTHSTPIRHTFDTQVLYASLWIEL